MELELSETCFSQFIEMEDTRLTNHNFRHELSDILIISTLATICGADGWVEIEKFGKS